VVCGIARDAGRRLQPALWFSWGGSPTVQRLRWRGSADRGRVQRLHGRVSEASGIDLPSEVEEEADPSGADAVYEDAIEVLRNRTRDHSRFPLVFEENMEYGFRRNVLGLRPIGRVVALAGVVTSGVLFAVSDRTGRWSRWGVAEAICIAALVFWMFVVRREWVRTPAEAYADRLLEAADTLRSERP
jgi:hypothetical protein